MPTYKNLSTIRNPDYDSDYWNKIRILYEGAKDLKDVLATKSHLRSSMFPKHEGEEESTYEERCRRAWYIPYMTQLVDYILATLCSDPICLSAGGVSEDEDTGSVEPFYDDFYANTSKPGARPVTFNQLIRQVAQNALLYRRAWVLIDFPRPMTPEGVYLKPLSRPEEINKGADKAYCIPVAPDDVLDWEMNPDDGELDWVVMYGLFHPRKTVEETRDTVKEIWTVYDREKWYRYIWEYNVSKPPKDDSQPTSTEEGNHSFGRVPLLDFELPKGLWAGGKLESIAIEHFNKRSALSWGQYRSLFSILVAKLQNPDPMNPVSEDGNRAVNQPVGPGRVWVGAEKDSLSYVSPDVGPFAEIRLDLQEIRDEMHRVLHQMAQSVDNSGAALQRSASSKKVDHAVGAVVSKELGRFCRDLAIDIYNTISHGRKEYDKEWAASGMDQFDEVSLEEFVQDAISLETVSIPSETFQVNWKYQLATKLLPGLTDEQRDNILDELKANLSAEHMQDQLMSSLAPAVAFAGEETPEEEVAEEKVQKEDPKKAEVEKKDEAKKMKKAPKAKQKKQV